MLSDIVGANERQVHKLKIWPEYFRAISSGRKSFEVRKNDRGYHVGHILDLREWDNEIGEYTGRSCLVVISYILGGGKFGLENGYVAMSVKLIDAPVIW